MENNKIIVGLDVGTTKVIALVGKTNDHGDVEILGMGESISEGVVQGVITNLDKTVLAINHAIQEAEESTGIDIQVVHVGIGGRHIRSSVHHGSLTLEKRDQEITIADIEHLRNDMYKILLPPGKEIIHVVPQDYIVDYETGIKDPVGMAGVRLEANFQIITARTSAIQNIHKCLKRANLKMAALMLEPLAASLAILSEEEKEAGICLIDIGGGTADMAIFHDGILRHTAVIPFGSQSINNDLKACFQLLDYQAELIKKQFGNAIPSLANPAELVTIPGLRNRPPKEISLLALSHIIEARMQEIIAFTFNEIIQAGYLNKLAAGIVITGGGAQLQSIKILFEKITNIATRVGIPHERIVNNDFKKNLQNPAFSTAVGLVLSGFYSLDHREQFKDLTHTQSMIGNAKKTKKKESQPGDFFKRIINKTKGLLIDDYESPLQ